MYDIVTSKWEDNNFGILVAQEVLAIMDILIG